MQLYKYETHAHTKETSKCSLVTAAELVGYYKASGYVGIFITDHFLNGNTAVPEELPWKKRIELFCRGYENALTEGQRIGIDVYFGWECSYRGLDLLTYGLDKQWLFEHLDVHRLGINEYCDLIHDNNGFIVHAHPFLAAVDMHVDPRYFPKNVDGLEIFNGSRSDFENECAYNYAKKINLLPFAGTDNHIGLHDRLTGIMLSGRLTNAEDMINAVRNKETKLIL